MKAIWLAPVVFTIGLSHGTGVNESDGDNNNVGG